MNISYGRDIDNNYIIEFMNSELFTHEVREKYYKFADKLHEVKIWLSE